MNISRDFHEYRDQHNEHRDILHYTVKTSHILAKILPFPFTALFLTF